ncbi:hypothetical protein [Chroococcidiopsis thermalis]|nr:hypothetical protein [Chroococcidiopsis thermalis]
MTSQQSTTTYTLHPFFTHHAPRTTHHPTTNYQLPITTLSLIKLQISA